MRYVMYVGDANGPLLSKTLITPPPLAAYWLFFWRALRKEQDQIREESLVWTGEAVFTSPSLRERGRCPQSFCAFPINEREDLASDSASVSMSSESIFHPHRLRPRLLCRAIPPFFPGVSCNLQVLHLRATLL